VIRGSTRDQATGGPAARAVGLRCPGRHRERARSRSCERRAPGRTPSRVSDADSSIPARAAARDCVTATGAADSRDRRVLAARGRGKAGPRGGQSQKDHLRSPEGHPLRGGDARVSVDGPAVVTVGPTSQITGTFIGGLKNHRRQGSGFGPSCAARSRGRTGQNVTLTTRPPRNKPARAYVDPLT